MAITRCNCSTLIELTRQTDFNTLNQMVSAVVLEIIEAQQVFLQTHMDVEIPVSGQKDIITINRGECDDVKLVIVGRKKELDSHMLQDVIEVYANQYRHLKRGSSDLLTGLQNRRVFDETMERLFGTKRSGRQTCIGRTFAIVDVDHFKRINDTFGHLYGDEILILLAGMMKESFRPDDWLFRYGGEEFIVILNNIDEKSARISLERFRNKIESRPFPQVGRVTVSIGFTSIDHDAGRTTTLTQADRALYFAKNNGRNQVAGFHQLIADGRLEEMADFGGRLELF